MRFHLTGRRFKRAPFGVGLEVGVAMGVWHALVTHRHGLRCGPVTVAVVVALSVEAEMCCALILNEQVAKSCSVRRRR